jgi:hypothetical protein
MLWGRKLAMGEHQLVSRSVTSIEAAATTAPPQMHWHDPPDSRCGAAGCLSDDCELWQQLQQTARRDPSVAALPCSNWQSSGQAKIVAAR